MAVKLSVDACEEAANLETQKLEKYKVLESILSYLVPKDKVSVVAGRLIERFGSLTGIYSASIKDLCLVDDVSESVAVFLRTQSYIYNNMFLGAAKCNLTKSKSIKDKSIVEEVIKSKFFGLSEEHILLMVADKKYEIKFCELIVKGNFENVSVDVKEIIEIANKNKGKYVIIAHNHPTGYAMPSLIDIRATKEIRAALDLSQIKLLDHYIITDAECISMDSNKIMPEKDKK